jgi:endoglucanase
MNKIKIFTLFTIIIILMSFLGCGLVDNQTGNTPNQNNPNYPVQFSIENKNIITDTGDIFHIKGIALSNGVYSKSTIYEAKNASEGFAQQGFLLKNEDYQNIKNLGLNSVRFYIQYTWLDDDSKIPSFNEILNEQIEIASANNIYIILSLHYFGNDPGHFYDGSGNYDLIAFWERISVHYKNNSSILGYDLINEPKVNSENNFSENDLYALYDQIISRLREIGDNKIILVSDPVNKYDDVEYYQKNDTPSLPTNVFSNEDAFQKINDNNIIYQYHWYKPSEFTHQTFPFNNYFEYGASYPYIKYNQNYVDGYYNEPIKIGNTNSQWETSIGTWTDLYSVNSSEGTHFGIAFPFYGANSGSRIWIDDVELYKRETNNPSQEIKIEIKNSNFEFSAKYEYDYSNLQFNLTNIPANWLKSIDSDNDNQSYFYLDKYESASGTSGSLYAQFVSPVWQEGNNYASWKNGDSYETNDRTNNQNQLIEIEEGYEYQIRFKVKTSGVTEGNNFLYGAFEWYEVNIARYGKEYSRTSINDYYHVWGENNNVPIYCGEFGVANPGQMLPDFPNSPQEQVAWINDMKDILSEFNHHWTYHDYKDFSYLGFGLFDQNQDSELKESVKVN